MILCPFCKTTTWKARVETTGESRVVESRRVLSRSKERKGGNRNNRTVKRLRECKTCRYRWQTVEVQIR